MQVVRHAADGAGELHELAVEPVDQAVRFGAVLGYLALQIAGRDAERGNLLAEIVMQLARQAFALFFVGVDEAGAELPDLLFLDGALAQLGREALASRSFCSARRRGVMSSTAPANPRKTPSGENRGTALLRAHRYSPS
jgi:hypothetical protein